MTTTKKETVSGSSLILKKLYTIMSEVDRIGKDAFNGHQKYTYASEKVIKETLHKKLVENKVIFQLETKNLRVENGITAIDCKYTFWDVESGESISGQFQGSGQARDEKGYYAAVTGAIKYILTSTFLIPTGDDPEKDEDTKSAPKAQDSSEKTFVVNPTKNASMPIEPASIPEAKPCANCGSQISVAKIAGPQAKRPGTPYLQCQGCGNFLRYTSSIN